MQLGTNGDSICLVQGLDAAAACRANQNTLSSFPQFGSTEYSSGDILFPDNVVFKGRFCNVPPGPATTDTCVNIKTWQCADLEKAINPYCMFAVPNSWTKTVHSEIKVNGGYTVRFWWKSLPATSWSSIDKGCSFPYLKLVHLFWKQSSFSH